jgi:AcrR family transcriptional regulator
MNQDSSSARLPKTARGRRTREKLLSAAEEEFGERGFHAVGIGDITRRAGVALGTFYVYFESKEAIYRDRLTAERTGLEAFLEFTREHPGLYRIISEAEFVANDAFVEHYMGFAQAYRENLEKAGRRGDIREGDYEVWSWAIMGMMMFLGLRFADWDPTTPPAEVAEKVQDLIANGIGRKV